MESINNGIENSVELNEQELEEIAGGKKANQKVKATGNLNVRKGPSKDYAILGTVSAGTELEFLGELKKDKRGVVWYKVRYAGKAAWVSSKYSKIV